MLVDGFLVPDPPHFLHRELSSPTLNSLAVAVVTTLLTYQLSAAVYALLFIRKPHGYASVATLFSVLLARHASPLAIVCHVTRWNIFTRLHYRRHLDCDVRIERERRQVPATVVIRLVLLCAVAPLSSMVALVLAASHTRELTFREAGINGLSFALLEKYEPIEMYPELGVLKWAMATRLPPGDTMLADLVQVRDVIVLSHWRKSRAIIEVGIYNRTNMLTSIIINGVHLIYTDAAFISLGERESYALHVDLEASEVYADRGIEVAKELCGWEGEVDHEKPYSDKDMGMEIHIVKSIPCHYGTDWSEGDAHTLRVELETPMMGFVSRFGPAIVTAEGLKVEKTLQSGLRPGLEGDGKLVDGLVLDFLKRRRRNCGLPSLVVLLCFLSLLRMVIGILGRNDGGAGLECVIKQQLGLRCCEGFGETREIVY